MKEMIYQTICPGCGVGCGLFIRENDEGKLSIDHMKSSPVNLGKLCRFGMKLPHYYAKANNAVNMTDGSAVDAETAIKAAVEILKDADTDSVALLSVGNTSNEEQMAFTKLAETLGTVVQTGIQKMCMPEPGTLAEIEKAKKIVLFVDPYVQYPLIVRRLLAAKKNGAHIISVGTNPLNLADETLDLKPEQYGELELDSESLIIADVHPNSDAGILKSVKSLAKGTGAGIQFMKPFMNSNGAALLANKDGNMMGLAELMEDIELGNIRTLVTLDSDPVELMPDAEAAIEALKNLDKLIVIGSVNGPAAEMADVVIATDPVYSKAGTFLNVEDSLQENSGTGKAGVDALSLLNAGIGGKTFTHDEMNYLVMKTIGSRETGTAQCKGSEIELSLVEIPEDMYELRYLYNPFMWSDREDDNDFVLLNRNTVKKLGLKKGGCVNLKGEMGELKMRFRVEAIPDGLVLTAKKLPIAKGVSTAISMEVC
ncbi:molybdopterin-dependent oxidoreductase [Methanolobus profundi]|uniref:Molybdopterin oxidoreductase Fe4S4 domain-containing protein n=1 Tax=Methanolobus profundi TaxID=487685 RepID=A0A1I4RUK8_9EURY|nr:molybdopterin-dependent oxidoreductase [Methanolobus profundi]SFM55926.1 Molybdopterin oxidoreductase Fe4S4 domain-containing protein [Methanolobus profundi]